MNPRVVMQDVAQFAGVSVQTVSRVINDSGAVSEHTRKKIQDAITTLGYRPNLAARSLAAGRSKALGVLVTGHNDFGISAMFRQVEAEAHQQGFYICVATAPTPAEYASALVQLSGQQVAGLIVLARSADIWPALAGHWVKSPTCMVLDQQQPHEQVSVVSINQSLGQRLLIDHVVSQGASSLCHISADMSWDDAQIRARTFTNYCQQINVGNQLLSVDGWDYQHGYKAAQQLIKSGLPDAILAGNDTLATGVIRALAEAKIRPPHDVLVTGFDNSTVCDWMTPSLTSVNQDFAQLASKAVSSLIAIIAGEPPSKINIRPTLIVRESTGGNPEHHSFQERL